MSGVFCPSTRFTASTIIRRLEFSSAEIEAIRQLVGHSIDAVERELICETLACRAGNRTQAANVLGISIRALRNKIRLYKNRGRVVPEPNPLLEPISGGLPSPNT